MGSNPRPAAHPSPTRAPQHFNNRALPREPTPAPRPPAGPAQAASDARSTQAEDTMSAEREMNAADLHPTQGKTYTAEEVAQFIENHEQERQRLIRLLKELHDDRRTQ